MDNRTENMSKKKEGGTVMGIIRLFFIRTNNPKLSRSVWSSSSFLETKYLMAFVVCALRVTGQKTTQEEGDRGDKDD